MVKKRKVPLRKCIVSNEMKPKEELIRVVRNKEGSVFVDVSGKQAGRGAYLTKDPLIIEQAEKNGVLNRQFKMKIDTSIYEELRQVVARLTNES